MKLYTICVDQRPVLVMSAGAEPPMEDRLTTDAELMEAHRNLRAQLESMPTDVQRIMDQQEIGEALETWLGEDLRNLMSEGAPLWDGNPARLHIREARVAEAEKWHASRRAAADAGEEDAGEEDWLVFLVPVQRAG